MFLISLILLFGRKFPYGQKYYKDQLDNPFNIIKVEFEEYFPTIYKYFKEYFLMNGNIWKTISMWTERLGRSFNYFKEGRNSNLGKKDLKPKCHLNVSFAM